MLLATSFKHATVFKDCHTRQYNDNDVNNLKKMPQ